jgi:hypothetical protein
MGAVQRPDGRPRQAPPVPRTLRPPRRRRGRPLAAALALVVVAALVRGAGAEESGTMAEPGLAEPGMLAATEQATELAEGYDAQALVAAGMPPPAAAAAAAGGDVAGEIGSDGGQWTGGQDEQSTQDQEPPLVAAEVRPEGQQPDGQSELAATNVPGVAGREPGGDRDAAPTGGAGTGDEPATGPRQGEPATVGQDKAGGPGGCTSGCSTQPPGAGDATAAAAGSWWPFRGFWDRVRETLGREQPQEPAQRPLEPTAVLDLIRGDLTRVIERQQQLAAEGGTRSQGDLDAARLLLARARGGIQHLGPQVEGTPEGAQLAALTRQAEELTQALGDPAQRDRELIDLVDDDVDALDRALTRALEGPSQRTPGRIDEVTWGLGILEGALTQRGFPARWATTGERARDQALVEQVHQGLERLRPEVEGTAQEPLFGTLAGRFQLVQEQLAREPATPWQGTELDRLEGRFVLAEIWAREAPAQNRQMLQDAFNELRGALHDLAALRRNLETSGELEAGPVDAPTQQRLVELGRSAEAAAASVSREWVAWNASPLLIEADEAIFSLQARLASREGGRWATAQERRQDLTTLGWARAAIEQLQAQVTEETPQADRRRVAALTARFQAMQRRLDREPATPWQGTELDRLEAAIRRAEEFQQDDEDPGSLLRGLFRSREDSLEDAAERIRQLRPQVAGRDPRYDRLRQLTERFRLQQQWLAYDKLARQQSPGESLQMRTVDPKDIAGTPGFTATDEHPGTPGFTTTDQDPGIPGFTTTDQDPGIPGFTTTDQDSGIPGFIPPQLDTRPLMQQEATQETSDTWEAATDVAVQTGEAGKVAVAGAGSVSLLYLFLTRTNAGHALLLALSPDVRKALPWMAPGPPPG